MRGEVWILMHFATVALFVSANITRMGSTMVDFALNPGKSVLKFGTNGGRRVSQTEDK